MTLRKFLPTALTTAVIALTPLMATSVFAAGLTVGFSQIGSESGWRAAETSVSKTEAQKRNINLKIADAQQKQENQIKAIRSFVAQGVDAIFLAPVVATGWDAVLGEAKDAKIPVILLDRDVETSDKSLYLTAVTSDSVHEGAVAGEWLAKQVGDKPCNVVELQGTVGASVATNRKKGFDDAIAKHANIKVIRSQTGDYTRSQGQGSRRVFSKPRTAARNICALYAHNDDMAVGAIQTIKEARPAKPAARTSWWCRSTRCRHIFIGLHGRRGQRHRRTDAETWRVRPSLRRLPVARTRAGRPASRRERGSKTRTSPVDRTPPRR